MKSLDKLQNLHKLMEDSIGDIFLSDDDIKYWIQILNEFIIDNEPKQKSTINLFDYIAHDELRAILNGVFHDEDKGYAVATDAHFLIASKNDYNPAYAGKVVDKYGNIIEGKFPSWYNVFPKMYSNEYLINEESFAYAYKVLKAEIKLRSIKKSERVRMVHYIGDSLFDMDSTAKLLRVSNKVKTNESIVVAITDDYMALACGLNKDAFKGEMNKGQYGLYIDEELVKTI